MKFLWLVCFFAMTAVAVLAQPEVETTAHRWLRTEFQARSLSSRPAKEQEYLERLERLDKFLAAGRSRLSGMSRATPLDQFKALDHVLAEEGFVCYVKTHSLWQTLVAEVPLDARRVYRRAERHLAEGGDRYPYDCDLGSILYLSVFESLSRPVVVVEVPEHNFVRWRTGPREHTNWDVNLGESFSDDDYRGGIMTDPFNAVEEKTCGYLLDMTSEQLEGYQLSLAAYHIDAKKHLEEKLAWNRRAHELYPGAVAKNNLAWLLATELDLQEPELLQEALELARQAAAMRSTPNILDTLAVVYAANGDFDQAITVEVNGNSDPNRLRNYRERLKPTDPEWNPDLEVSASE